MAERVYTSLYGFSGIGFGTRGMLQARARLFGTDARFVALGGIDIDPIACRDFEYLTGAPAWCQDIGKLTGAMLRARYGNVAPDVVIGSSPCQGASRLITSRKAQTKKYVDLNKLTETWIDALMDAWGDAPPKLVLIENVSSLPQRAPEMLRRVRARLRRHGYVFVSNTHDCGEIGGLAQHRQRFLLIARHAPTCAPLVYQPPKRRVRGVGEVLEELPMPCTVAARAWGRMHELPRQSWRNHLRHALIPAGGDWRDLEGVLQGRARREVYRRNAVQSWEEPHPAVTGPGGHSVQTVADPRVAALRVPVGYDAAYGVLSWTQPARTVAGKTAAGCGAYAVADPRSRELIEGARVLTLDEALALDLNPMKPPPFTPVIISEDGTWHRSMTLLELGRLQGLPAHVNGGPVKLSGTRTQIATHIGNALPDAAAEAIGVRALTTLLGNELGSWSMESGPVWVTPTERTVDA